MQEPLADVLLLAAPSPAAGLALWDVLLLFSSNARWVQTESNNPSVSLWPHRANPSMVQTSLQAKTSSPGLKTPCQRIHHNLGGVPARNEPSRSKHTRCFGLKSPFSASAFAAALPGYCRSVTLQGQNLHPANPSVPQGPSSPTMIALSPLTPSVPNAAIKQPQPKNLLAEPSAVSSLHALGLIHNTMEFPYLL